MKKNRKILVTFGTRPECIKLAPVIKEIERSSSALQLGVCSTGQHGEMLNQVLEIFSLKIDYDLKLMEPAQTLDSITYKIFRDFPSVLRNFEPDLVIVQGDTTTAFACGLSAFYNQIPVFHVEAGLRSLNIHSPWPEEFNRRCLSLFTARHYAPTTTSKAHLRSEGVDEGQILVTGNTGIDALLYARDFINRDSATSEHFRAKFPFLSENKKSILFTNHRRENFENGMADVFHAIVDVLNTFPDTQVIFPMHKNPKVRSLAQQVFADIADRERLHILDPMDYLAFVYLMEKSYFIITDSGGIQEEAPSLRKPILVTRNTTERPEAVEYGCAKLVGTSRSSIVSEASRLLTDRSYYDSMVSTENPYGDGHSSKRIVQDIVQWLK